MGRPFSIWSRINAARRSIVWSFTGSTAGVGAGAGAGTGGVVPPPCD
jgi:hypothetical protein